MLKSESINELAAALAKAQGDIHAAKKDSMNPHFKSKYADLASIWNACREPLSRNGLAVVQTMEPREQGFLLVTTLMHSSGQFVTSELPVPTAANVTPQAMGSLITYMRRYSLSSIVGVAPDDDDDGEHAERPKPQAQPYTPPKPPVTPVQPQKFTPAAKPPVPKETPKVESTAPKKPLYENPPDPFGPSDDVMF